MDKIGVSLTLYHYSHHPPPDTETSVRFNIIKRKIREICGICVRICNHCFLIKSVDFLCVFNENCYLCKNSK